MGITSVDPTVPTHVSQPSTVSEQLLLLVSSRKRKASPRQGSQPERHDENRESGATRGRGNDYDLKLLEKLSN